MLVNFHNQKNPKDHKNKIWPLKNKGIPQNSQWRVVQSCPCGVWALESLLDSHAELLPLFINGLWQFNPNAPPNLFLHL